MIVKEEKKIMFLCDQMKDCGDSYGCGNTCRHTSDPDHAKYPTHTNFVRDFHDPTLWWEREPYE